MIATLNGTIAEKLGELVVIDVGGIGYGVLMTIEDQIVCQVGSQASVYIYEAIRETSHDLFGFKSRSVKNLFELLLSVNGVGPKVALLILNLGSEASVRASIAGGDTKFISSASGVGKKVAERIVVDLKSKVGLSASDSATDFLSDSPIDEQDEAMQALIALGFSPMDASSALRGIDSAKPAEVRVKLALKGQR